MDAERIAVRRAQRAQFLMTLYEQVDGSVNEFVDGHQIAARVGADADEARRIMAYFEEKHFIKVDDHKAGIIRITAAGIDEVETGPS
jgi:hypothetical protein